MPQEARNVDGLRSRCVARCTKSAAALGGVVIHLSIDIRVREVPLELGEERVQEEDVAADLREARSRDWVHPEYALQQVGGAARDAERGLEIVLVLEEPPEAGVVVSGLLPGQETIGNEVEQDEPESPNISVLGPVWRRRCLLSNTFCGKG